MKVAKTTSSTIESFYSLFPGQRIGNLLHNIIIYNYTIQCIYLFCDEYIDDVNLVFVNTVIKR